MKANITIHFHCSKGSTMKNHKTPAAITFSILCLFLFFIIIEGCDTSDQDTPKVLDSEHSGWKNRECDSCHSPLPVEGHETSHIPDCAASHGGNGACDPNSDSSEQEHAETDDCIECHQDSHGFEAPSECISCHFATEGLDDCDSDSEGSDELVSNCFDWPETDFTPANSAMLTTGLSVGFQAVDFTLKDPSGTTYNLNELLSTKPVFLVFGAFT